jgi:hypothetical protein
VSTVCLIVLAGAHDEVQLTPAVTDTVDELVVIVNPEARFGGMGAIANRVIGRTACDVVGMIHADTTWGIGDVSRLTDVAARGNISGIVGCALEPKPYNVESSYIVWGRWVPEGQEVEVSTLDACTFFMRTDSGVRFDEQTFDTFHCCVEDVCLSAAKKGIRTLVPAVKADHVGTRYKNPAWGEVYARYRQKLVEKHAGTFFRTTTG